MTIPTKRWLTTEEAADYTGISAYTLNEWRRKGEGPAYSRPGPRMTRYDVEDLDAFMESYKQDAAGEEAPAA